MKTVGMLLTREKKINYLNKIMVLFFFKDTLYFRYLLTFVQDSCFTKA